MCCCVCCCILYVRVFCDLGVAAFVCVLVCSLMLFGLCVVFSDVLCWLLCCCCSGVVVSALLCLLRLCCWLCCDLLF